MNPSTVKDMFIYCIIYIDIGLVIGPPFQLGRSAKAVQGMSVL